MSDRLQVHAEAGIVTVGLRGKTTMMLSIEAMLRAVHAARRAGARNILFDLRDAESQDFHSRVVKLASEAPAIGITRYRMAFVGRPGDSRLAFIEDVGLNRGYPVKTFTEMEAARAWLAPGSGSKAA
jgi:hypothetical protein